MALYAALLYYDARLEEAIGELGEASRLAPTEPDRRLLGGRLESVRRMLR
jgi:hypothetical protein